MDNSWKVVWNELRQAVSEMPPCDKHADYPCVKTLSSRVPNHIVSVDNYGITVRSHESKTNSDDLIPEEHFRTWWEHLVRVGSATVDTKSANCPATDRSSITAAILARCLPSRVSYNPASRRSVIYLRSANAELPRKD
jgi:hypothetical protein